MNVALPSGRGGALLRETGTALLDLLLPRQCVSCDRPMFAGDVGVVCGLCWARTLPLRAPACPRCGHPADRFRCAWCDLLPPYVRAVRSVCWIPGGTADRIVHALKYHGWRAAASGMAQRMARLSWPEDVLDERTALIPVPLAASRERERGYNQSEVIASALAPLWGVPVWPDLLFRSRATATQTRLTPGERSRNVAGAFGVATSRAGCLAGAHVVLVDDVVTTAATLNACAGALLAAGTRIISYVTFGRARASGDRLA
ncbi:MAG TPA: double zinc ribbon domain-containing protein [Gemmatimonadaceae bacterium]|nr:double zinc ribbon domain-containing protein [Gemmatimonadaceae bacterium]